MAIKLVVAVTDWDWFNHLRRLPTPNEVNFWAPSNTSFKALRSGELFLFKLHAPKNFIVGGGIFTYATSLPCSIAWETFDTLNGATTFQQMRERIIKYRKAARGDRSDFPIGCRILAMPFFLPESDWIPTPSSWSPNIVSLKGYRTDEPDGRALWDAVCDRLSRTPWADPLVSGAFGAPQIIEPRLGQGGFRVGVIDAYRRKCAVTKERTLPALEAAHIRPYAQERKHQLSNGLLLRRDIHSLFDSGYVTVTPGLRFEVSQRIREEYENGRDYYRLHGRRVRAPTTLALQPDPESLQWHNEHCFKG